MNIKKINLDYKKLKKNSFSLQVSNSILVLMLAISLFYNANEDVIVINNANPSCEKQEISRNRMGEDSHIRLGYYMSTYLGNITPKNAKFVSNAVLPFVDANIYKKVEEILALELKAIVDDHVTYEFQPENAFYEDGKTFVTGKSITTGAIGNRRSKIRTFEFEFHVKNYTTTMKFINVYDELPHDKKWRKKQESRKEK